MFEAARRGGFGADGRPSRSVRDWDERGGDGGGGNGWTGDGSSTRLMVGGYGGVPEGDEVCPRGRGLY